MSAENMEALRRVYEGWRVGDFRAGVDLFDPAIVYVIRPEFPDPGIYVGLEHVANYMRGFLEPWTRLTITAEDFTEVDGSFVVAVRQEGTGTVSGAAGELRYFQVWSFRGNKVIRFESIRHREQALEAVGLDGRP